MIDRSILPKDERLPFNQAVRKGVSQFRDRCERNGTAFQVEIPQLLQAAQVGEALIRDRRPFQIEVLQGIAKREIIQGKITEPRVREIDPP